MSARRVRAWRLLPLLLVAACGEESEAGAFERMLEQPRYDAYEASEFFADGKVLRQSPEGTVPHDTGETARPVADVDLLERGRSRYRVYCAVCHGTDGDGDSVVALNMAEGVRPPPLTTGRVRAYSAGQIFGIVTRGLGRMPAYSAELTPRDVWAVVAYVQRLAGEDADPDDPGGGE